jgi:ferredoxin
VQVLAVLTGLTFVIPFFWCRYLCPYGALLGALGVLSPFKIRRDMDRCTGCEKCSRVCPARVAVHRARTVRSDECHACLRCVDACPVERTLALSAVGRRMPVSKWACAAAIVLIFLLGTSAARVSGYWHNAISEQEYRLHMAQMRHPYYQHNRGTVPDYDLGELGIHDATTAGGCPRHRQVPDHTRK